MVVGFPERPKTIRELNIELTKAKLQKAIDELRDKKPEPAVSEVVPAKQGFYDEMSGMGVNAPAPWPRHP